MRELQKDLYIKINTDRLKKILKRKGNAFSPKIKKYIMKTLKCVEKKYDIKYKSIEDALSKQKYIDKFLKVISEIELAVLVGDFFTHFKFEQEFFKKLLISKGKNATGWYGYIPIKQGNQERRLRVIAIANQEWASGKIFSEEDIIRRILHEISHALQDSWGNLEEMKECKETDVLMYALKEGEATEIESLALADEKNNGLKIKFIDRFVDIKFCISANCSYQYIVYWNIYMKLQQLTGNKVMQEWKDGKIENIKGIESIVDSKYGKGTFKLIREKMVSIIKFFAEERVEDNTIPIYERLQNLESEMLNCFQKDFNKIDSRENAYRCLWEWRNYLVESNCIIKMIIVETEESEEGVDVSDYDLAGLTRYLARRGLEYGLFDKNEQNIENVTFIIMNGKIEDLQSLVGGEYVR